MMGGALKELPRHELVISSKVFWPMSEDTNDKGLSRKHILESVNRSLQRVRDMKKVADRMECTRGQLALARISSQPRISSVLLGATNVEQLKESLGALRVNITPEVDKDLKKLFHY